jgi:hypothetical protein
MLSAEFYGHATGTLVFGVCQESVHAYKLNIIGCLEQSVLLLFRCKARPFLAKVRANRGLAVKCFLSRAQCTHAPVTSQAWVNFIRAHFRGGQAARVQYDP